MTVQLPIPDYRAARQAMVDGQLRPQGVSDPVVIAAMSLVPREQFLPEGLRPMAYLDRAIPLGSGRFLPPPEALGLLLTAIGPRRGERALVVSGGTGYAAAILTEIGVDVMEIEELRAQPGGNGEPFDLILIDGAVCEVPDALVARLRDGGRVGFGQVDRGVTRLMMGRKAAGTLGLHSISDTGMPVLAGAARPRTFTF